MVLTDLHKELAHTAPRVHVEARAVHKECRRRNAICNQNVVIAKLLHMGTPLTLLRLQAEATTTVGGSAGIEMQFQYRYQTLIWLCISIDTEISFHAVKCIIFHLLILQLSKIIWLTYKIHKTDHEFNTSCL